MRTEVIRGSLGLWVIVLAIVSAIVFRAGAIRRTEAEQAVAASSPGTPGASEQQSERPVDSTDWLWRWGGVLAEKLPAVAPSMPQPFFMVLAAVEGVQAFLAVPCIKVESMDSTHDGPRMEDLLTQDENSGPADYESWRMNSAVEPSHLTPARVHGGIGP